MRAPLRQIKPPVYEPARKPARCLDRQANVGNGKHVTVHVAWQISSLLQAWHRCPNRARQNDTACGDWRPVSSESCESFAQCTEESRCGMRCVSGGVLALTAEGGVVSGS